MLKVLDIVGYCVILLAVGLILVISGYLLLEYSHTSEREFSGSFVTKIMILWGASLSMTILLSMVIDIMAVHEACPH